MAAMISAAILLVRKYDRSVSGAGVLIICTLPPITEAELESVSGITPIARSRTMIVPACLPTGMSAMVGPGTGWACAAPPKQKALTPMRQDFASS